MNTSNKQDANRAGIIATFSVDSSYQAKQRGGEWLLEMLLMFANASDSFEDYNAIKEKTPLNMWPLWMITGNGRDVSWIPEAHKLFLFYRDLLRRFWTRDPETLNDTFQLALLFGAVRQSEWQDVFKGTACDGIRNSLRDALTPLRAVSDDIIFPEAPDPFGGFAVNWNASAIEYIPQRTFHRAVWLLFCQSWRAKACPKCSKYFLAHKPAQLYCSSNCSGDAHRGSSLNWWREKGSQKRASAKVKQDRPLTHSGQNSSGVNRVKGQLQGRKK